jgi:hypothetical protein
MRRPQPVGGPFGFALPRLLAEASWEPPAPS